MALPHFRRLCTHFRILLKKKNEMCRTVLGVVVHGLDVFGPVGHAVELELSVGLHHLLLRLAVHHAAQQHGHLCTCYSRGVER